MIEYRENKDWVWDRYWHFDRVASCFDSKTRNYPSAIKSEWHGFLDALPDDAKILDLCTGNGAVARIAAEFAVKEEKDFSIIGVDQADINPEKFVTPTKGENLITFEGGIAAEDLPFKNNEFDAVISQYGFEYTKTDIAAGELSKVLKPAGAGKLICHAEEGTPAANGREEVRNIRFVAEDLALFDTAREATAAAWKIDKADPEEARRLLACNKEKLDAFKAGMMALVEKAKEIPENPFLTNTYGLLRHTFEVRAHFPLETLTEKIEETKLEAVAHLGRVDALLDASLSEEDCRALKLVLESHGFSDVVFTPFYLEGGSRMIGWNFEFTYLAK